MIIALHQLKYLDNLAQIRRVVSAYGGGEIYTTGSRIRSAHEICDRLPHELRMKAYDDSPIFMQKIETFHLNSDGYTPIAIESVSGAQSLEYFEHPADPMYIFGPEDGSIPSSILRQCHAVVQIPTAHCINVSHAVATVLYDRKVKSN